MSFRPNIDELIKVELKRDNDWVPIELAGTGVLQATQILSYARQYKPSVLVLDEPDSHLHPNNQRLLCSLLQKIAEEREIQVLLTTHSRHVVDAIGSTARFLWVREGTVNEAGIDDEIGVLLDIGALDIKEKIAAGDSDAIVLTEDQDPKGLKALLDASGFLLNRTNILSYYGCTSVNNLRPLLRVIQAKNKQKKILVHRDSDYLTDEEKQVWERSIRRLKAEPFLTDGVDIESHFMNADHLAEVNDSLSREEAETLITRTFSEVETDALAKYVNGRTDLVRKAGNSATLDQGKLAVEATSNIQKSPNRYIHGKLALRTMRRLYRTDTSLNLVVVASSKSLVVPALQTFAKKAFRSGDR